MSYLLDQNLWIPLNSDVAVKAKSELQYYIAAEPNRPNSMQVVRLYKEYDGCLAAPRHYLDLSTTETHYIGPKFPVLHNLCSIAPRDRLQADVQNFLMPTRVSPAHDDAIVNLRCGEGKTYIGLRAAFDYGLWTIVIAHTKDILNSWRDVIKDTTDVTEIGSIVSGTYDLKPITLALVQSLLALSTEQVEKARVTFGCVLADELHHLSAQSFSQVGNMFPGRRIGLTATMAREDGLSFVYKLAIGDRVFSRVSARQKAKVTLKKVPVTDVTFPENYALAVSELAQSAQYLQTLVTDIVAGYVANEKQLVVSSRKELIRKLQEAMADLDIGVNTAETPPDVRHQNLKNCRIIIAIDQFAKEGLNEPNLTTVRVVTPMKDKNAVTQTVGRLERDGKDTRIEAWFYAPIHQPFLRTLERAKESLVISGYQVQTELNVGPTKN